MFKNINRPLLLAVALTLVAGQTFAKGGAERGDAKDIGQRGKEVRKAVVKATGQESFQTPLQEKLKNEEVKGKEGAAGKVVTTNITDSRVVRTLKLPKDVELAKAAEAVTAGKITEIKKLGVTGAEAGRIAEVAKKDKGIDSTITDAVEALEKSTLVGGELAGAKSLALSAAKAIAELGRVEADIKDTALYSLLMNLGDILRLKNDWKSEQIAKLETLFETTAKGLAAESGSTISFQKFKDFEDAAFAKAYPNAQPEQIVAMKEEVKKLCKKVL